MSARPIWPVFFVALLTMTGCASALPDRTESGIAIYIRPRATVEAYCYNKLRPEERGPRVYGCYDRGGNLIMAEEGHPEVLAHELRHAQGWEHRGPCHSTREHPDGLTLAGTPCAWYQR